ncbi:MAG: leucine-rich repeat domain-containing protein [Lachnospiraceae bacterium]|nr:leucine-rich repeat domain-containing protein [Lachnospiraceae bacterium]
MRGNERKTNYKKYKLLRSAFHRGMAVALGVFLLASQLDLATYAVEDSAILEEVDTENPSAVILPEDGGEADGEGTSSENTEEKQPETDDNGGEKNEQNPDGDDSVEEGNADDDVLDAGEGEEEPETEIPDDENLIEEAGGEESVEPVVMTETEETTEKEARTGEPLFDDVSGMKFEIIDDHCASISSSRYRGKILEIPGTVTHDGAVYTVTQISENGFEYSKDVERIVIPDSVKVVGKNAFISCDKASEVVLSQNLEEIAEKAFYNCASLERITIPGSVSTIGYEAFRGCKELTEVTLENTNNPIAYSGCVFAECVKLSESEIEKIISSSGMMVIPNGMFIGCNGLAQITIPENITTISANAFTSCHGLTKVNIPSSVTEIGEMAFEQCDHLAEISMADGLTTLGNRVFFKCTSLRNVEMPDTVTTVGIEAFQVCTGLERVKLSSRLSAVSDYMFDACSSLTEVTVPQSVTSIGIYGFSACSALQNVTLLSSAIEINDHAFDSCTSMNELKIVVPVTEENGQKKVTPITIHTGWYQSTSNNVFLKCPQKNPLVFLSTDGVTPLTGDDLSAAVDAYRKVTDIHESAWDKKWYGWNIPDAETPPVPSVTYFTINASATSGGTITPAGSVNVIKGDDQKFTMTPDEGYRIKAVTVDGNDAAWEEAVQVLADEDMVQTGKAGTYTFTDVQKDHTIEVSFETAGSITPGDENPPKGDDPDNPGNDKPSGGTTDSGSGNDNSGGGSGGTANTGNAETPAAEVMVTVVDGGVQAAPAVVTETEAPAAQNGQNQTTAGAQGKEPKTGDSTHLEIYAALAMIAGLAYMLLYYMEGSRGMTGREKEVFVAAFIRWAKKGGVFRKCCAMIAIFCILAYYHALGRRVCDAPEGRYSTI